MNRQAAQALALLAIAAATWWGGSSDDALLAYIGPGAGFAFLGSFLALLGSLVVSLLSLLAWPFRMAWRLAARRQGFSRAHVEKLVILGLDGLDPTLTERYLAEGKLPHLAQLKESGSYRRLRTTFPALSPVAWSTFATGVNPARHNIFDFLNRDLRTYMPELATAKVRPPQRVLRLGRFEFPLSRPTVEMRRKSEPFWKILGRHAIGCTILRVPVTFPPDEFDGKQLSAMSTPDLQGTQGSFSWFSASQEAQKFEGGNRYALRRAGDGWDGELPGPASLRLPFRLSQMSDSAALLVVGAQRHTLKVGEYSPWILLRYKRVAGIARFLLTRAGPAPSL